MKVCKMLKDRCFEDHSQYLTELYLLDMECCNVLSCDITRQHHSSYIPFLGGSGSLLKLGVSHSIKLPSSPTFGSTERWPVPRAIGAISCPRRSLISRTSPVSFPS